FIFVNIFQKIMIKPHDSTSSHIQTLEEKVWLALEQVPDPEIPMVSVVDLGIITDVIVGNDNSVTVKMTPTFSCCSAINLMRSSIENKLKKLVDNIDVKVEIDKSVSWNSNLITEKGLAALKKFGLAPPPRYSGELDVATISQTLCPYCDSDDTRMESP